MKEPLFDYKRTVILVYPCFKKAPGIKWTYILIGLFLIGSNGCRSCRETERRTDAYRTNETEQKVAQKEHDKNPGLVRSFNNPYLLNPWTSDIEFLEDESNIIIVQNNRIVIWDWKKKEIVEERSLDFSVRRHAISEDRSKYFLSSQNKPFKILAYNTKDLSEICSLEVGEQVQYMDFNDKERKLLIVTTEGVGIWDLENKQFKKLLEQKRWSMGKWMSSDYIYLADSDLAIYGLKNKKLTTPYTTAMYINSFLVEKDKNRIIIGGHTDSRAELPQHLDVWSVNKKKRIKTVETPECTISDLYKLNSNSYLAFCNTGIGRILKYNQDLQLEQTILEEYSDSALSKSKKYLAVSNVGIKVFELPSLKMVTNKNMLYGHVKEVKFLKGGDWIAGSDENMTMVWDVKTGNLVKRYDSGGRNCLLKDNRIMTLDEEEEKFIVSNNEGKRIETISIPLLHTGFFHLNCRKKFFLGSVLGKRGRAHNKAILRYLDKEEEGKIIDTKGLATDDYPSFNQVYTSDHGGNWIMILNEEGLVIGKWNTKTLDKAEKYKRLEGRTFGDRGLSVSRNGQIVLVYGNEKIYVINAESLEVLQKLRTNKKIAIAALDNNGTRFAMSEEYGKEIVVWNKNKMRVVNRFSYENASVTALEFGPNDRYLAAGYGNSEVILWDLGVKAGKERKEAKRQDGGVKNNERLQIAIDRKKETD